MRSSVEIRGARLRAGLTQAELAQVAGTSQAAVSQYERGRKEPEVVTLARLLAAAGAELRVDRPRPAVRRPTAAELRRAGQDLERVVELAALLPTRHDPVLRYPRLPVSP